MQGAPDLEHCSAQASDASARRLAVRAHRSIAYKRCVVTEERCSLQSAQHGTYALMGCQHSSTVMTAQGVMAVK